MTLTAEPVLVPLPRSTLQLIRTIAPLRVLHILPSLHGGGMEHATLRLLSAFADGGGDRARPDITHGVCVLQGGDPELLDRCRTIGPTWVLGTQSSWLTCRHTWRRLREIITEFDPDVVHARTTSAWFDATFALRHNPRTRLVLSFHGRTSLEPPGWLRRRINRWTCGRADAVLAVSCEAARMLEYDWEVPPSKIRVISNGVDVDRFHPRQAYDGEPADVPAHGPADHVVICVAQPAPDQERRHPATHLAQGGHGGSSGQTLDRRARAPGANRSSACPRNCASRTMSSFSADATMFPTCSGPPTFSCCPAGMKPAATRPWKPWRPGCRWWPSMSAA